MQSKWFGRVGLAALLVGVTCGSGLIGCASERDPINRVQAGVVDKTFFLGADIQNFQDDPEFRTKTYNIDSAANTDSYGATIGGSSAIDRVRWEVTEKFLFARRSYQESPGADDRGIPREVVNGKLQFTTPPNGTIIAAYKIDSHFDIRRDYNSQTGEQTNVIVENSTDRPWNQRQYMRVDWSQNLAESTSGDISWLFGEGTKASAISYASNDDGNPDAPHFEVDNGYFDVTNKYTVNSEPMPGWGISECVLIGYFNQSTSYDCSPTEVKVRSSFVKLTGDEDFEPFEESFAQRDIVGNWGNAGNSMNRDYGPGTITAWDPQYGYTDAQSKTFYTFHNIWEKSHQNFACDSNADEDADGTADQCAKGKTKYAGSNGSQCDTQTKQCTIPVRDREVKTIAYWLNKEAPAELLDEVSSDGKTVTRMGPIEENGYTWNQLLSVAVATRREVECRRTHDGDRATCHALYFNGNDPSTTDMVAFGGWGIQQTKPQAVDKGKPVFASCHNPVRAYDLPVCGKPGEEIRLGDIRKNFQIYWPYASRAPYGGVATIGADPTTGEMVGETATIMMRSVTWAAGPQRDIIQLALGDITMDDVIANAPASNYADAVKKGRVVGGLAQAKTQAEIQAAIDALNVSNVKKTMGESAASLDAMKPVARQLRAALLKAKTSPQTPAIAAANDRVNAAISQLAQTPYRADIANRNLYELLANAQDKSSQVYQAISQFAAMDTSRVGDLFDKYQAYLGDKGVCFYDSASTAGSGSLYQPSLAPYFKKLYGDLDPKARGEKIYQDLVRETVKGIAFHELGHSLGLRHNFASSWDAMNYLPQYWQLRTNEGNSTATCKDPRTSGPDNCMGPRYLDPMSDDEQGVLPDEPRPGIEYFANTSTMEYQIERFGETAGAGLYDLHAMKTLYGRTLETFDPDIAEPVTNPSAFGVLTLSQGIPSDLVLNGNSLGMHYTNMAKTAKLFDPARDCRDATEAEKATAKWRIVHGKVCTPQSKLDIAYQDMKSGPIEVNIGKQSTPVGADGVRYRGQDETGRDVYRWQYRYGEDYSAGGYMHAKMMDSGADEYEITMNTIRKFDVTYPWQYFRRQNKEFAWWALADRIGSTFKRIRGYHWNTATDIGRASAVDLKDDNQARPAVMASAEMFRFLQRAILTPEPGSYTDGTTRTPPRAGALKIFDVPDFASQDDPPPVGLIGLVDGRYVQIDFDNTRGGSWDYQAFPAHVGFDMERVYAIRELVDARPTLSTVSRENALDGRDPDISFRTDTPQAIDRLLGGLLSEDWETIAPSLAADGSLTPFDLLATDATKLVRPAGTNIAFPNIGYSNELGAGIYGLLFSRFSTDMTLANKLRIRAEGDAGPTIPMDRREAFSDPNSGQRYLATRFGTEQIQGRAVELGIGSRVLQRANELLAAAYKVQKDPNTNAVIVNGFGEPALELDGNGKAVIANATAEATLRRYVGLIDAMRQVGNILGGGPLGGGGGDDE